MRKKAGMDLMGGPKVKISDIVDGIVYKSLCDEFGIEYHE